MYRQRPLVQNILTWSNLVANKFSEVTMPPLGPSAYCFITSLYFTVSLISVKTTIKYCLLCLHTPYKLPCITFRDHHMFKIILNRSPMFAGNGTSWTAGSKLITYGGVFCAFRCAAILCNNILTVYALRILLHLPTHGKFVRCF